jgi:hypothetical protein
MTSTFSCYQKSLIFYVIFISRNIRMDLEERGVNTRSWIDLVQQREYWSALVKSILLYVAENWIAKQ